MIKNIYINNLYKILPKIFIISVFCIVVLFVIKKDHNEVTFKKTQTIESIYVADFTKDEILIGSSHNVFAGKVIKQKSKKERGIGAETQFVVEVIANIKGELKGQVTVNQQGGIKDGVLYMVEDGSGASDFERKHKYLLKPNYIYLFATRYNEKEDWYTLNSFYTGKNLIYNEEIDEMQLRRRISVNPRVQELKEAYKEEILLEADMVNNNTLNSYNSLSEEEKEKINIVDSREKQQVEKSPDIDYHDSPQ